MAADVSYSDPLVSVQRLVVGPIANNVYFIQCRQTGVSLMVDAASEPDRLLEHSKAMNVQQVVTTHGHWDHIGAVPDFRAAHYPVGVHADDAPALPAHDFLVADNDVIAVGDLRVHAIATPGHTSGSVCFAVADTPVLVTGDTLFPGGPGATNKPGSNFDTIMESITTRLFDRFDDSTLVLPGHGDNTTLGAERPHLQEWMDRRW